MKEEFTEQELEIADKVAGFIVKRGFAVPAILFVEMHRPLNYLGSQLLVMLQPFVNAFLSGDEFDTFIDFLEKRPSVDILLDMLETKDKQMSEKVKKLKKMKKKKGV